MKKYLAFCLLSFLCFFCFSESENQYFNTAVGFSSYFSENASLIGLTYQEWFDNEWGFQFSAGAIKNDSVNYSLEVKAQRFLTTNKMGKRTSSALFLWASSGVFSTENYSTNTTSPSFFLGTGFGIEFILFNHISIPITVGIIGSFSSQTSVATGVGIGVLYRF